MTQGDAPALDQGPSQASKGAWRVLALAVGLLALAYALGEGETVLLIVVLLGCIVAHELGHYLAARGGGVKVSEFFVGFGPRVWSFTKGETEYGVKAIPAGGYCRILGMNNLEEVDPKDEGRTYRHAPLWRRLLIDLAGPAANVSIGLVVLFAMFFFVGDSGNYLVVPANNPIAAVVSLQSGPSPAQEAGLRPGDRIEAVDGRHFTSWDAMASFIAARPGQRLVLSVDRHGQLMKLEATPVAADGAALADGARAPAGDVGFLGVAVDPVVHSSFVGSVEHSASAAWWVADRTFVALGHLLTLGGLGSYLHMLTSPKAAASSPVRFSSPVRVVQVLHQATAYGLSTVLWVLGLINVSIGVLNLLPLFPLDGARVAVGLYEGLRSLRRPYRVDMRQVMPVFYLGLGVFAFIALTSLFLDVRSLVA